MLFNSVHTSKMRKTLTRAQNLFLHAHFEPWQNKHRLTAHITEH